MKKNDLLTLLNKRPFETTRAILQPMTEADFPEYLSHTAVATAVAGSDMEDLFKEKCRELLSDENTITFTIRLKKNGMYIGYFELSGLDALPELGIDLIESHRRQGLGYEICRSVINYLFCYSDIAVLKYKCFRINTASLRLAKKLGAVKTGEVPLFEDLQSDDLILVIHEIRNN